MICWRQHGEKPLKRCRCCEFSSPECTTLANRLRNRADTRVKYSIVISSDALAVVQRIRRNSCVVWLPLSVRHPTVAVDPTGRNFHDGYIMTTHIPDRTQ